MAALSQTGYKISGHVALRQCLAVCKPIFVAHKVALLFIPFASKLVNLSQIENFNRWKSKETLNRLFIRLNIVDSIGLKIFASSASSTTRLGLPYLIANISAGHICLPTPPICNVGDAIVVCLAQSDRLRTSLWAIIIILVTFYHIRCFLLSKDAFKPNLAEFGPVS